MPRWGEGANIRTEAEGLGSGTEDPAGQGWAAASCQVCRSVGSTDAAPPPPTPPSLVTTLGSDPAGPSTFPAYSGPSPTPFPTVTLPHGLISFLALITNQILLRGWLGSLGGGLRDGVELEGCAVRALGSTLAGGGAASRSRQRDVQLSRRKLGS